MGLFGKGLTNSIIVYSRLSEHEIQSAQKYRITSYKLAKTLE
jgi:hypothetical protein